MQKPKETRPLNFIDRDVGMEINFIAISIGNSRTQICTFIDGALTSPQTIDNSEIDSIAELVAVAYLEIADKEDAAIILASVVPDLGIKAELQINNKLSSKVIRIERDMDVPIGRQIDEDTTPGEDRLLNCAGAYDTLKQECIVVDAGTAITVDFVDGQGTFHGGAIMPGMQMMLNAMHSGGSLLPELKVTKPTVTIGHNTKDAMLSGVYYGARGAIFQLIEKYAEQIGSYPLIITTGGDAELLFDGDDLIDRIVPNLTLLGMKTTIKSALEAEKL